MKVIGAGFGRTGTTTLKVALEELGFGPCYHTTELLTHPRHREYWRAAVRGENPRLNDMPQFQENIAKARLMSGAALGVVTGLAVLVAAGAVHFLRGRRRCA